MRRNPHQHPFLYLKDVKYKELLSVINFMYLGEVSVAQDELNSFLNIAEDLRVKGLTHGQHQPEQSVSNSKIKMYESRCKKPPDTTQLCTPGQRRQPRISLPPQQTIHTKHSERTQRASTTESSCKILSGSGRCQVWSAISMKSNRNLSKIRCMRKSV